MGQICICTACKLRTFSCIFKWLWVGEVGRILENKWKLYEYECSVSINKVSSEHSQAHSHTLCPGSLGAIKAELSLSDTVRSSLIRYYKLPWCSNNSLLPLGLQNHIYYVCFYRKGLLNSRTINIMIHYFLKNWE